MTEPQACPVVLGSARRDTCHMPTPRQELLPYLVALLLIAAAIAGVIITASRS